MRTPRPVTGLTLVVYWIAFANAAGAQTSWIDPGSDDWFAGANWSAGVPTSADVTSLNNGGTAVADRSSPSFVADPTTADLNIGVRNNPMLPAPIATGRVELIDVNLDASGGLQVGVVNTLTGLFHNATGSLSSAAGANADGDVSVDGDAAIGHVLLGPAGATATGNVNLAGDLTGDDSGDLIVGQTADSASANGNAMIGDDVAGFQHVFVGRTNLLSTGNAMGGLNIGGTVTAAVTGVTHEFDVGTQAGNGMSMGFASVGHGIFGFDFVAIGSGSTQGIAAASGTGILDVLSGGIHTTDGIELAVGGTNGPGDVNGTATVAGGVSGYGIVDVGFARQQNTSGNATGTLRVTSGGLEGTHMNDLIVGQTAGSGTGNGTVSVAGDVTGYRDVFVGRTNLMSTGNASGILTVGGSVTAATAGGGAHEFDVGTQAGDGMSMGMATVFGGIFDFHFVAVGSGSTQGIGGASGAGTLNVPGGGIHTTSGIEFAVGGANGPGDVDGTANVEGGVSGYRIVDVGYVRQQNTSGNATGVLNITGGGLSGIGLNDLIIGQTAGPGTGNGTVSIADDMSGYRHVRVGRTNLMSTGNAIGDLTVGGSVTAATMGFTHEFTVGTQAGNGTSIGTAQVDLGIFDFDFVAVGSGSTQGIAGASGTGTLDVLAGGIHTTDGFELAVGGTNGPGNVDGTVNVAGGVSGYDIVDIGHVRQAFQVGDAIGVLTISDGGLIGNDVGDFIVGRTVGSGTANGTASITGDVAGYQSIYVGSVNGRGIGGANGALTLNQGTTIAQNMEVAITNGSGTAMGMVSLDQALVDLAGTLALGENSQLVFHLDGFDRGSQYGAIDADVAELDGLATILFDFTPSLGTHHFDLIVSGSNNGITGDFEPGGVSILNLPAPFSATTGIVIDQVGGQDVEIYRLTISGVPEPASALLICCAVILCCLAARSRATNSN